MIRDPDADAEVREIERDLLDAAAAGTLDSARLALVEERLMHEPRNRAAVLVARALAEHHARVAGTVTATATAPAHDRRIAAATAHVGADGVRAARGARSARSARSAASIWRSSIVWPAAAALLVASGLGLFVLQSSRGDAGRGVADALPPANADPRPGTLDLSKPPSNAASNTASNTASNAASTAASNADAPANTAPSAAAGATPGTTASAAPPAANAADLPRDLSRIVALVLPAGTLRGAQPSVTLPREAETLRLEIELDDAVQPTPAEVTVSLRALTPASSGATAFEWTSPVRVRVDNDQPIAVADVPAQSLPTGPMEATITWPASQPRVIPFHVRRN